MMRHHRIQLDALLIVVLIGVSLSNPVCLAFVVPNQSSSTRRQEQRGHQPAVRGREEEAPTHTTLLRSLPDGVKEQGLRDEIAKRNSMISNEAIYAVVDGSGLEKLDEAAATTATADRSAAAVAAASRAASQSSSERDELLALSAKTRAYPLFLLEKGLEVVEGLVDEANHVVSGWMGGASSMKEEDGPGQTDQAKKERIVVLGTGWGGVSLLKEIDNTKFDVTVISPRNHFVFTPMLAGASVGTVEYRSICEPIREINRYATFLEATALSIDVDSQVVSCESVICEGNSCQIESFDVPYDRLVVTVGAQTNTFGIPGVKERCNFLKTVKDARRIKDAMVNCFERANLPGSSDQQKIQGLTFCVIGAGPTGIEFAAELRDFVEEDGPKYYPNLLRFVRIKVIEASPTILAPFDKSLQQEAIRQMQRKVNIQIPEVRDLLPERFKLVELLLESSVKEVTEDTIDLMDGRSIPYGMAVWAAGNGPIPLTLDLIKTLGAEQARQQDVARGRLAIDPWMRAIGGNGRILSFGDCSCITARQLPATAQVASQQGEYLAKLLNKGFNLSPEQSTQNVLPPPTKTPGVTKESASDVVACFALGEFSYAKTFQFLNLGILAYTGGGSALAQVTPAPNAPPVKGSGKLGNAVWRSVYLSKQVSWRNRLLVLNDWTNRQMFGRDITRI